MPLMDQPVKVVEDRLLFLSQRSRGRSRSTFDRSLGGRGGRSQRLHQTFPVGADVGVDVLDDLLGRLGHHTVLDIEIVRASHGHVHHRLVALEELQPHGSEGVAQRGGDADREPLLLVEGDAQQGLQRSGELGVSLRCEGVHLLDDRRLVHFGEVRADFFHGLEHLGLRHVEGRVLEAEADRLGPLLHDRLILHDLHTALVHVEVHP